VRKTVTRALFLHLATNKLAENIARKNPLSKRMIRRFVSGETVEEAADAVLLLNRQGYATSIDLLGESVTSADDVEKTVQTYLHLITIIRKKKLNTTISVKLTALGLDINTDLCRASMERILRAAGSNLFVQIDMEGTPHTQRTLDLFYSLRKGFENVGAVIQAYLYRSESDIEDLIKVKARVRLCKGAYRESAEHAFPKKSDVDTNYVTLAEHLITDGNYPGFATHDPQIITAIKNYAEEHKIHKDRFEFQMLYGVRRDLQAQLIQEGYNLTIYTPFGEHWYPYFMRRLAERPANVWFVLKSLIQG
jgi:proline dehydrogenase